MILLYACRIFADDERAQYPKFVANSYLEFNTGYIDFPFSDSQLQPPFQTHTVHFSHGGMRFVLGHAFSKILSAQLSYMKPFSQPVYEIINGNTSDHSVWMHIGGITLKTTAPIGRRFSVYGEGGFALITRRGFDINNITAVQNANYGSVLVGSGFEYSLHSNWNLVASISYVPSSEKFNQPSTIFLSGGVRYTFLPLADDRVQESLSTPYIFPRNMIQAGYSTNTFGYGTNNFLSEKPVAIFFGGKAEVEHGLWFRYQRNVFHTRKFFSFDIGTSYGNWKSDKDKITFSTLSVYPLFRLTLLHSNPLDLYFNYSLAGPTCISETLIDDQNIGKNFTFQDFLGMGVFFGKKRNLNAEINLNHYSNGNIFPANDAVKVPLTFSLGYTF
ncbi:MAG TPA: acyloxyacyl hydrolase [Acidobacteriota bacterium]|nr:acyloxyacyl hydrolase [Acidobacteriota bacterium]